MPRLNHIGAVIVLMMSGVMLCTSLPLHAQHVDSLLFQLSERYKDLNSYHVAGTTHARVRRGRQTQETSYTFQAAERFPGRLHIRIGGERARSLVANGKTTWAFHPASNTFVERPGLLESAQQRSDFPDLLSTYKRLSDNIEKASFLAMDSTVVIGDSLYRVHIVEAIPRPTMQTRGQSIAIELWIDPRQMLVLRERTSRYIPESQFGPVSITQTMTFNIVSADVPPQDSLFTFTLPETAQRVPHIDAFPNLPITLHGSAAPAFSLPVLDKEEDVLLEAFLGNVIVLNFWATWCAPCRAEMSALQMLEREWRNEGLAVLAINEEELPEIIQQYIREERLELTIMLDRFGLVSRQFEVTQLPTTFIIDREGIIREHLIGARTEEDFRRAIEPIILENTEGQ